MLRDSPLTLETQKEIVKAVTSILLAIDDEIDRQLPHIQELYGSLADVPAWERIIGVTRHVICRLVGWTGEGCPPKIADAYYDYREGVIDFDLFWECLVYAVDHPDDDPGCDSKGSQ